MDQAQTVFVIAAVAEQQAISAVAASLGYCSYWFTTTEQFLGRFQPSWRGCLVLDVPLFQGGLEVVEQVRGGSGDLPLIVLSDRVDVAMAVETMRRGARTVLEKPCTPEQITAGITDAIGYQRTTLQKVGWKRDVNLRLDALHTRERAVLDLMMADVPNKTIARRLGVGRRTVDRIRACVLEKMGADSALAVARMLGEMCPVPLASSHADGESQPVA
jgi:two-component system response regulator FixJ